MSSWPADGSILFIIWMEFSASKMDEKSHALGNINKENPERQGLEKLEIDIKETSTHQNC